MGAYTYYYFFSFIILLGAVLHVINMIYFRAKDRLLFMGDLKFSLEGHKKLKKVAGTYGLSIAVAIVLLAMINFGYSAYRLMQLDTSTARFVLVFAPIFSTALFGWILQTMHRDSQSGKRR
jgi:Kef-type K+ transport system membrane component KefB